ncbi:MAG TPA: tetratricopeptide repeat protein [Gammaproteobacteria bacterium]
MDEAMKHVFPLGVLAGLACLAGCAGLPAEPDESRVAIDSHSLLAEVALEDERYAEAAQHFLEAAAISTDPSLAERATRVAYEAGLDDKGLAAARRWLEIAPEDPRGHWFAGVFTARHEQQDEAIRHFTDFVAGASAGADPGPALALVVEALTAEPDPAAGTAILSALVEAFPDTAEGHYGLARLAMRSGDFPLALEHARAATEQRPEWVDAQLLYARALLVSGRSEESLALAERLAETSEDPEAQLQYAELLLSAGRMDEARERLTAILDENPGLPEATRALAFLAMAQDRLEEANRLFDELRYHDAYRDEAFYYLGRIAESEEQPLRATRSYSRVTDGTHAVEAQLRTASILMTRMNDPNGALRHLQEFGEANPRFRSDMLVARAQLLVQMDRAPEALQLFEDALAADPEDATLHEARAQLYVMMAEEAQSRGDYDEAEGLLETGLERYPENTSLRYSLALLLQETGDMRKSVRVLEELVEDHPDNPVFLNALGYLLTDQFDRHEEAREYIQKALAMDPDNAAIIDSMGWVLFKLGNYRSAFDYLDRAYRLEQDPEIAAHLVDVRWALGEREEALDLLEAALRQNPDNRHLNEVERRLKQ